MIRCIIADFGESILILHHFPKICMFCILLQRAKLKMLRNVSSDIFFRRCFKEVGSFFLPEISMPELRSMSANSGDGSQLGRSISRFSIVSWASQQQASRKVILGTRRCDISPWRRSSLSMCASSLDWICPSLRSWPNKQESSSAPISLAGSTAQPMTGWSEY